MWQFMYTLSSLSLSFHFIFIYFLFSRVNPPLGAYEYVDEEVFQPLSTRVAGTQGSTDTKW